ncbi:MAG TPA: MBL fold metallo-hydrolase [Longimicrobiaceae bacterium]|nr:MBL fold metallo-hydrolase [Longimicrobiaceae bacterium]
MRVTVLGSGSAGNSILVEAGGCRLLIDAGFSGRDLERRLAAVEVAPDSIEGLLVTHDHGDHTRGMGILARRWKIPLYLTAPTRAACAKLLDGTEEIREYASSTPLEIGELVVDPFLTVHDAVDPVAVTVTEAATGEKMGIATDLGRPTATVRHALRDCDLLILEANHDEILLRESPYPWSIKARIAGSHGHLSNRAAAELIGELYHSSLGSVVLAHLSERSNDPGLAHDVVGDALDRLNFDGDVQLGLQDRPLDPIDISALRRSRMPDQMSLF